MQGLYKKLLIGLLVMAPYVGLFGQGSFYYYQGTRIDLEEDRTSIVFYFTNDAAFKNDEARFASDGSIIEKDVSDGTGDEDPYFARLTYATDVDDILGKLSTYGISAVDLEMYSYGYRIIKGDRIWPTHEVLFKLNRTAALSDVQRILDDYSAVFFEIDKYQLYSYKVSASGVALELSNELWESGFVQYAEPDFLLEIELNNHDFLYNEQFYLNNFGQPIDGVGGTPDVDIDAPEAWTISNGIATTRVAVIDDGVDRAKGKLHVDMVGRVIDGYTPNCSVNCDGRPRSTGRHGQACAGLIAANHNNIGVRGVASGVTIVPIRMIKNNGKPKSSKNIAKALNKAWDDFECDVFSIAWGISAVNVITNAIDDARTQGRGGLGTVVVAAAGNGPGCTHIPVAYPASIPGVIAVGGVNKFGTLVGYSAVGPEIDVVGPTSGCGDDNVRTTDRMGNRGYNSGDYVSNFTGTSAASPMVAGIAALLISVDGSLTEAEIRCRIREGARDIGPLGIDNDFGAGLANAYYTIALNNMTIANEDVGGRDDFAATNQITVANAVAFFPGSQVNIIAGTRIRAVGGSRARSGSNVHVFISNTGPCGAGPFKLSGESSGSSDSNVLMSSSQNNVQENMNSILEDIEIYPNPTPGQFVIELPREGEMDGNTSIVVYNVLGKVLYRENPTSLIVNMDLSSHSKGIYYISVVKGNAIFRKKLVINN